VRLTSRSSMESVAAAVAHALARARIRAVLTGGACAALYSRGAYQSADLDFILQSAVTPAKLNDVMRSVGFKRAGNYYKHLQAAFIVEFPAGPLGIGADIGIRPVIHRIRGVGVRVLSATDSCRDRLAGYFHWNDRQSLATAVLIAQHQKIDLRRMRAWSIEENALEKFLEFVGLVGGKPGERRKVRARSGRQP